MTTAEIIIRDAFAEVTNSGDEAPIEADDMQFAIRTLNRLALKLAPAYDSIVTTELKGAARGSLASLRRFVIRMQPSRYPSRLPTGTGNFITSTFYAPQGAELIQEEGGSILLES